MALRLPRPCFIAQQTRAFTTSVPLCAKSTKNKLREDHANVPAYPYGPNRWFKQSNHGLYGGARLQFGNNVSKKTKTKTRRQWRPNVNYKTLWSNALHREIRVRLSLRVLRTIDKVGGLDEYLLGEKAARIKELGMGGWLLRWRLMQTDAVKKRFATQRRQLGLPETTLVEELTGAHGQALTKQELEKEIAKIDEKLDKQDTVALVEETTDTIVTEEIKEPKLAA